VAGDPGLTRPHRRQRATRAQIVRRRLVALLALGLAGAAVAAAVVVALPHVHRRHALPPAPPPPKPFRVIFPEGFTRAQMAVRVRDVARIARKKSGKKVLLGESAYLAGTRKAKVPCFGAKTQTDLEGFLFPATYDFLADTTSKELANDQLTAFCQNWKRVSLAYARSKNLTAYDVLTIASMVEKEAEVPSERPLVAAVIYNRLHAQMALGIDSTLRYGLHIAPTRSIRESQLQDPTPYNTRVHTGLPPTPIANPGMASIEAAAKPAKVDYLYFVRKPDHKHHFFTASGTAFQQYECAHGYGC
jgi:peptidoglycan lytic transglycosylase G